MSSFNAAYPLPDHYTEHLTREQEVAFFNAISDGQMEDLVNYVSDTQPSETSDNDSSPGSSPRFIMSAVQTPGVALDEADEVLNPLLAAQSLDANPGSDMISIEELLTCQGMAPLTADQLPEGPLESNYPEAFALEAEERHSLLESNPFDAEGRFPVLSGPFLDCESDALGFSIPSPPAFDQHHDECRLELLLAAIEQRDNCLILVNERHQETLQKLAVAENAFKDIEQHGGFVLRQFLAVYLRTPLQDIPSEIVSHALGETIRSILGLHLNGSNYLNSRSGFN